MECDGRLFVDRLKVRVNINFDALRHPARKGGTVCPSPFKLSLGKFQTKRHAWKFIKQYKVRRSRAAQKNKNTNDINLLPMQQSTYPSHEMLCLPVTLEESRVHLSGW